MTGRRDFHRLPTGAWANDGPAPVDRAVEIAPCPIPAQNLKLR